MLSSSSRFQLLAFIGHQGELLPSSSWPPTRTVCTDEGHVLRFGQAALYSWDNFLPPLLGLSLAIFICLLSETVFHCTVFFWNSLCRLDCPHTHRDLPAFACPYLIKCWI